jgi:hypothetical protein
MCVAPQEGRVDSAIGAGMEGVDRNLGVLVQWGVREAAAGNNGDYLWELFALITIQG